LGPIRREGESHARQTVRRNQGKEGKGWRDESYKPGSQESPQTKHAPGRGDVGHKIGRNGRPHREEVGKTARVLANAPPDR